MVRAHTHAMGSTSWRLAVLRRFDSPARSDGSIDDPPLKDYPDYGRDGLLSTAFTGDTKVLKLMLALGPEVRVVYQVPAAAGARVQASDVCALF